MSEVTIEAFVPTHFVPLRPIPSERDLAWFQRAKLEITGLSKDLDYMLSYIRPPARPTTVQIEELAKRKSWPSFIKQQLQRHLYQEPSVLHFSLRFSPDKYSHILRERPESSRESELAWLVATDLGKTACDVIMLANLAKPGCLATETGYLLVDGEIHGTFRGFRAGAFERIVESSEDHGWPLLQEISVGEVVRWAIQIPGFIYGMSAGKVGRALGTISYLLKESIFSDENMDIFWALMGLEALYCDGTTDLRRQLQERTELFLGERTQNKKSFGRAYDFRSRFVHGDIDFPLQHDPYDASEEYGRYVSDHIDATDLVVATLVATLQKLCRENRQQLNFKTVLTDV